MSGATGTAVEPPSGCHWFVVTVVMPFMTVVVAIGALIHGAKLTIDVERAAYEGPVDVRITEKILGVLPLRRSHLTDVTDVDSTSSTNDVTDSRGRRTSSYTSGRLVLTTRAGREWSSAEISHSFGHPAGEMEERIEQLLATSEPQRIDLWSMSWLSNTIGVAFTLVALLFVANWIRQLLGGGRRSTAE